MFVSARASDRPIDALIDTGATGIAFIDLSFAQSIDAAYYKLPRSFPLYGFDGSAYA